MQEWLCSDLSGYAASALVLATFSMRSMRWLRITAIASNIAFITYGLGAALHPIVALHCTLLPLNVVRLAQILGPRRRATDALISEPSIGETCTTT